MHLVMKKNYVFIYIERDRQRHREREHTAVDCIKNSVNMDDMPLLDAYILVKSCLNKSAPSSYRIVFVVIHLCNVTFGRIG